MWRLDHGGAREKVGKKLEAFAIVQKILAEFKAMWLSVVTQEVSSGRNSHRPEELALRGEDFFFLCPQCEGLYWNIPREKTTVLEIHSHQEDACL